MLKINMQSLVKPKIVRPAVIVLLIACLSFFILLEKEKNLRKAAEKELTRTIQAKKIVENDLIEAKAEIVTRNEEIRVTLDKLEKEVTSRRETDARLIALVQEKDELAQKVEQLALTLPKSIELEKIVIKAGHGLEGRVLAYDKDAFSVTVAVGNGYNLRSGDIISLYRGNSFIGKAQVENVGESSSTAAILSPWRNVDFRENDLVKKI